jgi:hypothetical protein
MREKFRRVGSHSKRLLLEYNSETLKAVSAFIVQEYCEVTGKVK